MPLPMTKIPGVPDNKTLVPGMAHFQGTGPFGKTCGACKHWNKRCAKFKKTDATCRIVCSERGARLQILRGQAEMTLAQLTAAYRSDPHSNYCRPGKLRYRSRVNYEGLCGYLDLELGGRCLADIRGRDLQTWHEGNAQRRGVPMAHGLVAMLRTVVNFGVTILEEPQCVRLSGILTKMKFEMGKPRKERLTAAQVLSIRAMAHHMGRPSIALAQAFQFVGMLRQKDCIGEYVPIAEPGVSDVIVDGMKWLRGIRWEEIDANLILRHVTSKRGKEVVVDLKADPMVMEELDLLFERPTRGPIVVSEVTGVPWSNHEFRRWWRKVARAAGVPDSVYNMDTRAGAITEALQAGAALQSVKKAATHSTEEMTQRYSRDDADETRGVLVKRVAYRLAQ